MKPYFACRNAEGAVVIVFTDKVDAVFDDGDGIGIGFTDGGYMRTKTYDVEGFCTYVLQTDPEKALALALGGGQ